MHFVPFLAASSHDSQTTSPLIPISIRSLWATLSLQLPLTVCHVPGTGPALGIYGTKWIELRPTCFPSILGKMALSTTPREAPAGWQWSLPLVLSTPFAGRRYAACFPGNVESSCYSEFTHCWKPLSCSPKSAPGLFWWSS